MSLTIGKPVFKATLRTKLLELSKNANSDKSPEEAIDEFLDVWADATETWIKAGVVSTTVVGSSATGGPVTGTGTGSIS